MKFLRKKSPVRTPPIMPIGDAMELIPLFRAEDHGNALAYRALDGSIVIVDFGIDPRKKQPGGLHYYNDPRHVRPPQEALPNMRWLNEHARNIKGIFVSHGHLDHCAALPFLHVRLPVYGSLVAKKLTEKQAETWEMKTPYFTFLNGKFWRVETSPFSVISFPVPHSVPQAKAFVIDITNRNKIFRAMHLGEFKFHGMETHTRPDLERRLAEYAKDRPIDLLVIDAIRADMEGITPPKITVVGELERIIGQTPERKRIVVSFFASDFDFMKEIFSLAARLKKRVRLYGRSMKDNFEIGQEINWWRDPMPEFVEQNEDIAIATGNQGEKRSALDKAGNEEGTLELGPNDILINFARPIPGNEEQFEDMARRVLDLGVTMYLDHNVSLPRELHEKIRRTRLHVSGHGLQEDIKHAIEILRPRYVVPLHPNAEGIEFFRGLSKQYSFKLILLP